MASSKNIALPRLTKSVYERQVKNDLEYLHAVRDGRFHISPIKYPKSAIRYVSYRSQIIRYTFKIAEADVFVGDKSQKGLVVDGECDTTCMLRFLGTRTPNSLISEHLHFGKKNDDGTYRLKLYAYFKKHNPIPFPQEGEVIVCMKAVTSKTGTSGYCEVVRSGTEDLVKCLFESGETDVIPWNEGKGFYAFERKQEKKML